MFPTLRRRSHAISRSTAHIFAKCRAGAWGWRAVGERSSGSLRVDVTKLRRALGVSEISLRVTRDFRRSRKALNAQRSARQFPWRYQDGPLLSIHKNRCSRTPKSRGCPVLSLPGDQRFFHLGSWLSSWPSSSKEGDRDPLESASSNIVVGSSCPEPRARPGFISGSRGGNARNPMLPG